MCFDSARNDVYNCHHPKRGGSRGASKGELRRALQPYKSAGVLEIPGLVAGEYYTWLLAGTPLISATNRHTLSHEVYSVYLTPVQYHSPKQLMQT